MKIFGLQIRFGKYGVCFYTNWLVKFGGAAYGPFVFIRPRFYPEDEGLFQHEMCHTRQFWNPFCWFKGKLWWELQAYAIQTICYDRSQWSAKINRFSEFISKNYGLDIEISEAKRLLTEKVNSYA